LAIRDHKREISLTWIKTVKEDEAVGELKAVYERIRIKTAQL